MGTSQASLDLPLIVEATNEFYRQVYADAILGPIFRGLNMLTLRKHISYFVYELTHCEASMTELQIEHLRKVHTPIIAERHVNRRHFDILVSMLIASLRECGAQGQQLLLVQKKLRPFREIFPPQASSSVDGLCLFQDQQHSSSSRSSSEFGSGHSREHTRQRHHQPHHKQQQQLQQPAGAQPDEQHARQEHHIESHACCCDTLQLGQGQQKQFVQIRADHTEQIHMVHAGSACYDGAVCSFAKHELPRHEMTAATATTGCSCKDASAKAGQQQQQDYRAAAQRPECKPKPQLWWQRLFCCINSHEAEHANCACEHHAVHQ